MYEGSVKRVILYGTPGVLEMGFLASQLKMELLQLLSNISVQTLFPTLSLNRETSGPCLHVD